MMTMGDYGMRILCVCGMKVWYDCGPNYVIY